MSPRQSPLLVLALAASWLCSFIPVGLAASATTDGSGTGMPSPSIIVLVHGAHGGGWQFKQVGAILEAKGWTVYRPTLSGLGERHHTATADIGLATHIDDIVNLVLFEDLHDVVLLGHSYAGIVVSGVADRIPERIKRLVYLDAFLPVDGESLMTTPRPDEADDLKKLFKNGFIVRPNMMADAPPPRLVPQPGKTFTDTITLKNPAAAKIPGSSILTVAKGKRPGDDTFYVSYVRAKDRGWPVRIMEGSHFPMLIQPEATADLLLEILAIP
jgi:pimeloyl-ACP methyl ester carboxylesterase